MAHGKIVVGFPSDMIDDVDVEVDSGLANSVVNGFEPSSPSHISSTGSSKDPAKDVVQYCQYAQSEEDSFIHCGVCGTITDTGTYCPMLCNIIILED